MLSRTDGMTSVDECILLYRMAKRVTSGCIVEVGAYRGRSAAALGLGSLAGAKVSVFAVDPHIPFRGILGGDFGPQDRVAFYQAMISVGCGHVVALIGVSSEVVAPSWTAPVALLWIDGDHSYEGVCRDFECWSRHCKHDSWIAFDDVSESDSGPARLVEELCRSGSYRLVGRAGKIAVIERAASSERFARHARTP